MEKKELIALYEDYQREKLALNMARGRPSDAQLNRVQEIMDEVALDHPSHAQNGTDCRNYGGDPGGIFEMKAIFADMVKTDPDKVLALGNSSLNLMFEILSKAYYGPLPGQKKAWREEEKVSFLCPVPGYDRHFSILEYLGIFMIPIPMTKEGPDLDEILEHMKKDPSIRGMICVPKYSNPDGYVYSEEVCRRLAQMDAPEDFLVIWDNAYACHHLYEEEQKQADIPDILSLAEEAGHPNRFVEFASTSKMTYAGAGVAALIANQEMRDWFLQSYQWRSIGPNKMVQLYHAKFFERAGGYRKLMKMHADILRPKFERVLDILDEELSGTGLASWNIPLGGYFVSVNLKPGMAKKVVQMCQDAGVKLTKAGAAFPYHQDPLDQNIRLAPSYPPLEELEKAIRIFCLCVKIAGEKD